MLFTIIGNIIALGAVGALVAAVIKKDRLSAAFDGDVEQLNEISDDEAQDTPVRRAS